MMQHALDEKPQEQVVLGALDVGERIIVVVAATRIVSASQNYSLVANGKSRVVDGHG